MVENWNASFPLARLSKSIYIGLGKQKKSCHMSAIWNESEIVTTWVWDGLLCVYVCVRVFAGISYMYETTPFVLINDLYMMDSIEVINTE